MQLSTPAPGSEMRWACRRLWEVYLTLKKHFQTAKLIHIVLVWLSLLQAPIAARYNLLNYWSSIRRKSL